MQPRDVYDPHRSLLAAALGVVLSACAVSAPAADPPLPSAQSPGEQASKFYQEGNEAITQNRWQDAEAAYLKAWAIIHSFDIAENLGEVELRLDKPRQAAEMLSFALRTAPPSAEPAQRERSQHFLKEVQEKVFSLYLSVSPKGARVLVDGVAVDPALLGDATTNEERNAGAIYLDPGDHKYEVMLEGYTPRSNVFHAEAGARMWTEMGILRVPEKALEVKTPAPPPPPPPPPPPWAGPNTAVLVTGGATRSIFGPRRRRYN